ncbi:MAG: hypothetical protein WEA09_03285 [Gemmatimonadota bacterium]
MAARFTRSLYFILQGLLLVSAVAAAPRALQGQFPPDQNWRTLESEHFRVHFPAGLESLAHRTALRAESARGLLIERFLEAPQGRVDVVLTDHTDIPNGFASPFPRNRMVIYARPPMEGPGLNWFDEWVELVVTHELVHIHHLDYPGTPGRITRRILGRVPLPWPSFPGWTTPDWITEGVATWYESALTGAGRGKGTWHETVIRVAALEDGLETIHQTSGISPVWPGGARPYIYGSQFMDWLQDRHGEAALGAFFREVAESWIPYRLNRAAERAFGSSLSQEWELWTQAEIREAQEVAAELPPSPLDAGEPELLTQGARDVRSLRILPDGSVTYLGADGRSDGAIHWLRPPEGEGDEAPPRRERVQGLVGISPLPQGGLLVGQYDFQGPWTLSSDLYRLEDAGGWTRITRGARLTHPDAHPSGAFAVAVQEGEGMNALVAVDLETASVTPLAPRDPDLLWAYPRWSPDGRWLAVIRRHPGAWTELIILDGRLVTSLARAAMDSPLAVDSLPAHAVVVADRGMHTTPAWSPDGRWLLWSSDRSGISNLMAVEIFPSGHAGPLRQITSTTGAALDPAVDGRQEWIYYAHYTAQGWEVARLPFRSGAWTEAHAPAEWAVASPGPASGLDPRLLRGGSVGSYSPWRTLLPTWWEPLLEEEERVSSFRAVGPGVGAALQGEDVVGRHGYRLEALYRPTGGRSEWGGSYGYSGWGVPQLLLGARQSHTAAGFVVPRDDQGLPGSDTLPVARREVRGEGGIRIPRVTFRRVSSATFLVGVLEREFQVVEPESGELSTRFGLERPRARFLEGRMGVSTNTARTFPFSISPEDGTALALQGRVRRQRGLTDQESGVPGRDGSFGEVTGQLRMYRTLGGGGYARRVLAFRVHGGSATGPGANGFHFALGGAAGGGALPGSFLSPGARSISFPLRGYSQGVSRGRHVLAASAELRLPVGLIHRGAGLLPFYGRGLSVSLWWDGGSAWAGTGSTPRRWFHSVGGEVLAEGLAFFALPITLRGGVAVPLEEGRSPSVYLRFGRSF